MPVPLCAYYQPPAQTTIEAHSAGEFGLCSQNSTRNTDNYDTRILRQQSCLISHYNSAVNRKSSPAGDRSQAFDLNLSPKRSSKEGSCGGSAEPQSGWVTADDAVIDNQVHVEACQPVSQRPVLHSAMGLQAQDAYRLPLAEGWSGMNSDDGSSMGGQLLKHKGESCQACVGNIVAHTAVSGMINPTICPSVGFPTLPISEDSLVGNSTPFADYIDRMVAAETNEYQCQVSDVGNAVDENAKGCGEDNQEVVTADQHIDPAFIKEYRVMAEPLSEWVANYVWRMCTTGLGLSQRFVRGG